MSSYSHPSGPYQPSGGNVNHPLQPHQVTGYSSLAAWHGGHPPAYPPRGQPAPPPLQASQPLAAHHQPRPHQPPSGSVAVPPPIPNRNNRAPVPPSTPVPQQPNAQGQLQFLGYSPSFSATGRGELVIGTPSTCVCGASFNAPRERERHWRAFKCGSSNSASNPSPGPASDLLVIPGKYAGQKSHEVDKKWLAVLLKAFEADPYPSKEVRAELAWNMKLPRYSVDNWFWWEREARDM